MFVNWYIGLSQIYQNQRICFWYVDISNSCLRLEKNAWTSDLKWCNYIISPAVGGPLFKVAVGNFCKRASKLMLAVAWDLLGSKSAAAVCVSMCFTSFVVALTFKSSLNWDEMVAGKLVHLSSSSSWLMVWLADTLLLAEESQSMVS